MRRRITAAVAVTTVLGAGAAVGAVAAGRWARGAALATPRAGRPAGFAGGRVTVHSTAAGRIVLTRTPATLRPGTFGLAGPSCHAVVGPLLDEPSGPDSVVRRLERVTEGRLSPGTTVVLTPELHRGDPLSALGIAHTEVYVPGEEGPLPAWFVAGSRDTWVIALHGLGTTRAHPLNLLPFLHHHHFPVLIPAYRGDPGAPAPHDRADRLGPGAWPDAEAAVRYAVEYGARRVVLYGWSSGAAMALRTAARSGLRDRLAGLVLDSPVLEPAETLRALALRRGVPGALLPLAVRADDGDGLLGGDERPLGEAALAAPGPALPVLILHGPDDTVAPWRASRELAARQPAHVTLHVIPRAEHAAMWNADPAAYEERLRRFLTPLM
ncbi:hypothetical protein RM780_07440 [Streptomyces sp. DSM 44917]|uniref:AB hydrolase-1 domain-containing protein n=1 Tax=Streptomyces boetiae TaxID=3075541 RepID=A0ABU2L5J1_9ACTN|nr:alpha/beta fold hydrolase [Streptomyces sp. DSM 44917]MDT0306795.1 hypothetical protein [Streptomyces sp. DSM 44917]